jgi:two-component sensor histidine kinase
MDTTADRRIEQKLDEHSTRLTRIETLHETLEQQMISRNISVDSTLNQINQKLDRFTQEINELKVTLAKYLGVAVGAIAIIEFVLKYFIK